MLKLIVYFVSLFLIFIIFLRIPKDSVGLTNSATKSNFLGSPSSGRRILNALTWVGIFVYFGIAIKLNF